MADDAGSIPADSSEENLTEKILENTVVSLVTDDHSPDCSVTEDLKEEDSISKIKSVDPRIEEPPGPVVDNYGSSQIIENEVSEDKHRSDFVSNTMLSVSSSEEVEKATQLGSLDADNENEICGDGKLVPDSICLPTQNENAPKSSPSNVLKSVSSEVSVKAAQQGKRIFYSGYKRNQVIKYISKPEKKIMVKNNPFNPSWKKGTNVMKALEDTSKVIDLTSSPGTSFSDCTHYLGLQPSINFRCSHCGISGFESIQKLNLHQVECRKILGHSTSTNIKITRKVYLCSACGTYYESWHLFYHMRKVHDKFMCLYCLGMFTYSEKLSEHLMSKHNVKIVYFPDFDSFKKCNLASYLFLCLECDNVMADSDNFNHVCVHQTSTKSVKKFHSLPASNLSTVPSLGSSSKKAIEDSSAPSKSVSDSEFLGDASSFCHIDMQSPTKGISTAEENEKVKSNDTPIDSTPLPEVLYSPPKATTPSPSSSPAITPPRDNTPSPLPMSPASPPLSPSPPPKSPTPPPKITISLSKSSSTLSSKSNTPSFKSGSFLSEFPRIGLQPPKNSNEPKSTFDKFSDRENKSNRDDDDDMEEDMDSFNHTKFETKIKIKPIKRQRKSTSRQMKRPKLDPDEQKSALERLTETIDAVAKNYSLNSSSLSPVSDDRSNNANLFNNSGYANHDYTNIDSHLSPDRERENTLNRSNTANDDITSNGVTEKTPIWKSSTEKHLAKFKMNNPVIESDEESDDSNKLSMVIDETPAHSDNDSKTPKLSIKDIVNHSDDGNPGKERSIDNSFQQLDEENALKPLQDEIILAGEDVPAMALTLDDKVEVVKVQQILKECVRTSCMSCNYCRRAIKIAVNGKYLALHLLSEHRYMPTKNDSPEELINKLKSSLDELACVYFNTESYDSSDPTIHVPYDKDITFDCFQCNYVTHSHKELHLHKRKSHTKSLLLCIMCKINFYSYSELLCHLCPGHYNAGYQFNNIDMHFRCCFCRLDTIPSAFRLMVHLRKCHHTCDICLEVCSDQQKLSTHMWKHKLNHLCYRCGIAYASKLDITKHLFWKHGTESVLCKKCLQKKWPHVYHFCIPPTSFLCEECNSSFSKAVALKVHKRIHANDYSYHCTQCEKKFVSKKLLQRHEDQHNNPVEPYEQDDKKEEIIDVTGESTGNNDGVVDIQVEENDNQKVSDKETEPSKHHKKHKKDKKTKQVIDVYDLPPLNLSSDSDSSDEESSKNTPTIETGQEEANTKEDTTPDNTLDNVHDDGKENIEPVKENSESNVSEKPADPEPVKNEEAPIPIQPITNESVEPTVHPETFNEIQKTDNSLKEEIPQAEPKDSADDQKEIPPELPKTSDSDQPVENTSIWENFYKTNSTNKNLPYPLCAMKSEDAYKIIMGDHDYCKIKVTDPVINEDILQANLEGDTKIDPVSITKTELNETTASESSPTKKKQKSPKKKSGNNSSSSSESSSDSDSSSCSCGDNCSCSSSSSDSSSSSSSDSDSSASEGANKLKVDKRKKRKDKKSKGKNHSVSDLNGENKTIIETVTPAVPEEPTIRESELETDESSTDEEFYDKQPQKVSNQLLAEKLLAEKRNQLMLLASVAPVHGEGLGHELAKSSILNDAFGDFSVTAPLTPESSSQQSAKKSSKNRRKKSFMMKSRKKIHRNYPFSNTSQSDPSYKSPKPFNPLKLKEPRRPSFGAHTPPPAFYRTPQPGDSNSGAGSENEHVRSSKRKRIPNKFYGYSSGEEEERFLQPKWRKPEVFSPPQVATPKFIHSTPHTPKIQLSVPKQIIRKDFSDPSQIGHYNVSGNESTDSSSDTDRRFNHPFKPHHPPLPQQPLHHSTKQDKDLYCFCRCPYDEVSEMIACDDDNCKIEWFHFECVGISVPPKGQWYCPQCSKKRGLLP